MIIPAAHFKRMPDVYLKCIPEIDLKNIPKGAVCNSHPRLTFKDLHLKVHFKVDLRNASGPLQERLRYTLQERFRNTLRKWP